MFSGYWPKHTFNMWGGLWLILIIILLEGALEKKCSKLYYLGTFAVCCSAKLGFKFLKQRYWWVPGESGTVWANVSFSVLATLYSQTWRDLSFLDRGVLNCTGHLLIYKFVRHMKSKSLLPCSKKRQNNWWEKKYFSCCFALNRSVCWPT